MVGAAFPCMYVLSVPCIIVLLNILSMLLFMHPFFNTMEEHSVLNFMSQCHHIVFTPLGASFWHSQPNESFGEQILSGAEGLSSGHEPLFLAALLSAQSEATWREAANIESARLFGSNDNKRSEVENSALMQLVPACERDCTKVMEEGTIILK